MAKKIKYSVFLLFIGLFIIEMGCNPQAQGFALPEGSIEAGQNAFVELNCNTCHSVGNIEWVGDADKGDVHVDLGGKVTSIKTYGELVTSVINPSHKIARRYNQELTTATGESKMWNYNYLMTVQDLVDLVTFLQSEYELTPPPGHYYY